MIDIRDPGHVFAAIEDAKRRFEKGGRVPSSARQLLVELHDGLADSGPLELGTWSRQWLWALDRVGRAVASLQDDRVQVQVQVREANGAASRPVCVPARRVIGALA